MHKKSVIASLLSVILLSACGGSDSNEIVEEITPPTTTPPTTTPPTTTPPTNTEYSHSVTGAVVYHGDVVGASVCVDLNQNQVCDTDEPSTVSTELGLYTIEWTDEVESPEYQLIATWTQVTPSSATPAKFELNGVQKLSTDATKVISMPVVNANGEAKLYARQNHEGIINYFTHLEQRRYLEMIANDLTEVEADELLTELSNKLSLLIGSTVGELDIYVAVNDLAFRDRVILIEQIISYFELILGDFAFEILTLEELLVTVINELVDLAAASDQTVQEYLNGNPLDASFVINNALTMLGHIENPFDDRIMNSNDWQVIETNLFSETELLANLVSVNVVPDNTVVSVQSAEKLLLGTLTADGFYHHIIDFASMPGEDFPGVGEDELTEECWNQTEQAWQVDDVSAPVEPVAPDVYSENSRTAKFMVADANVTFAFNKVDTQSEYWQSVLAATPAGLSLNNLTWPTVVYGFSVTQDKDVMCRVKDIYPTYAFAAPVNEIADLTTSIIAQTLYPEADLGELMVDEDNKQFYPPYNDAPVTWNLIDGPNGTKIVKVEEVGMLPAYTAFSTPTYFKVEISTSVKQLEEITLYQTSDWQVKYPHFIYTYDNSENFTNSLFNHFENL